MTTPVRGCSVDHMGWLSGLHALVDAVNQAVYEAVVGTATPCLDRLLVGVSNAANYSRLWLVTDAAVAAGRGRRAACQGVLAVALTSAVANLGLKPPRSPAATRPVGGPSGAGLPPDTAAGLHVVPSGHAASAFASAMGQAASTLRLHLHVAAATVAYPPTGSPGCAPLVRRRYRGSHRQPLPWGGAASGPARGDVEVIAMANGGDQLSAEVTVAVMNPRSGGGKMARFRLVERAGAQVRLTDPSQDAASPARVASAEGARVLGVAGGDGTVSAVAAVAAEAQRPLVVIPAGTRNHFARDLGLDITDPASALA
jgi:hypothetical protein